MTKYSNTVDYLLVLAAGLPPEDRLALANQIFDISRNPDTIPQPLVFEMLPVGVPPILKAKIITGLLLKALGVGQIKEQLSGDAQEEEDNADAYGFLTHSLLNGLPSPLTGALIGACEVASERGDYGPLLEVLPHVKGALLQGDLIPSWAQAAFKGIGNSMTSWSKYLIDAFGMRKVAISILKYAKSKGLYKGSIPTGDLEDAFVQGDLVMGMPDEEGNEPLQGFLSLVVAALQAIGIDLAIQVAWQFVGVPLLDWAVKSLFGSNPSPQVKTAIDKTLVNSKLSPFVPITAPIQPVPQWKPADQPTFNTNQQPPQWLTDATKGLESTFNLPQNNDLLNLAPTQEMEIPGLLTGKTGFTPPKDLNSNLNSTEVAYLASGLLKTALPGNTIRDLLNQGDTFHRTLLDLQLQFNPAVTGHMQSEPWDSEGITPLVHIVGALIGDLSNKESDLYHLTQAHKARVAGDEARYLMELACLPMTGNSAHKQITTGHLADPHLLLAGFLSGKQRAKRLKKKLEKDNLSDKKKAKLEKRLSNAEKVASGERPSFLKRAVRTVTKTVLPLAAQALSIAAPMLGSKAQGIVKRLVKKVKGPVDTVSNLAVNLNEGMRVAGPLLSKVSPKLALNLAEASKLVADVLPDISDKLMRLDESIPESVEFDLSSDEPIPEPEPEEENAEEETTYSDDDSLSEEEISDMSGSLRDGRIRIRKRKNLGPDLDVHDLLSGSLGPFDDTPFLEDLSIDPLQGGPGKPGLKLINFNFKGPKPVLKPSLMTPVKVPVKLPSLPGKTNLLTTVAKNLMNTSVNFFKMGANAYLKMAGRLQGTTIGKNLGLAYSRKLAMRAGMFTMTAAWLATLASLGYVIYNGVKFVQDSSGDWWPSEPTTKELKDFDDQKKKKGLDDKQVVVKDIFPDLPKDPIIYNPTKLEPGKTDIKPTNVPNPTQDHPSELDFDNLFTPGKSDDLGIPLPDKDQSSKRITIPVTAGLFLGDLGYDDDTQIDVSMGGAIS